jgi:hypothetical protein
MMHGTHINTLQFDARYTQRHITHCNMMHDTHINTLQYDARYTH